MPRIILLIILIFIIASFVIFQQTMTSVTYTVFATIFLLAILRQILHWTWLWQIKEYRLDRMRAHLETLWLKELAIIAPSLEALLHPGRPKFTHKALSILGGTFLVVLCLMTQIVNFTFLWFLFFLIAIFLVLPAIMLVIVFAANLITNFAKREIIKKAQAKITQLPHIIVIGITGSYGKSTVKEILAEILTQKFSASGGSAAGGKVLKTPANINTPIGIAKLILEKLTKDCQIFIVEMGAYKKGEIRELCEIVHPQIGILTAINEQHLALFGTLENTIAAKFELIQSLPPNGLAVLNYDNEYIKFKLETQSLKLKAQNIKFYSIKEKTDIYATDIKIDKDKVEFRIISGGISENFSVNLCGAQNIPNVLAAAVVAQYLGMTLREISDSLGKIKPFPSTLMPCRGPNDSILIDDTHNANPEGVISALDYLKVYSARKIIVMPSLIELGRAAGECHRRIGEKIGEVCDIVVLLEKEYAQDIIEGINRYKAKQTINHSYTSRPHIALEKTPQKAAMKLIIYLQKGDVVLFVNRLAKQVLERIRK